MSLDIDLIYPFCEHCGRGETVFSANITHNLNTMADEAGIYEIVWRPDENKIDSAGLLIGPLQNAIKDMMARPEHYKKFDSSNGWGTYDDFVPWLQRLLEACRSFRDARIVVSR